MVKLNQLKHGTRVTCEIKGIKIDDAKISIDEDGFYFICQNKIDEMTEAGDLFGYKCSWFIGRPDTDKELKEKLGQYEVTNLKLKHRTIDDLEQGDIVVNGDWERKVLGVCGELYFMSECGRFNESATISYTLDELKDYGYTLKDQESEEEIEEVTMEEVCKKFGKTVKIIKEE